MGFKSIGVDQATYERLRELAEKLNVSMASLLRILVYSISVEDSGGFVTIVLHGDVFKPRRVRVVDESYIEYLESSNLKLREKVEKLMDEVSKLKRELKMYQNAPREERGEPFITALREHGLLTLAKEYVLGVSDEIVKYASDDALYKIRMIKDKILEAQPGEASERRKLHWVM